MCNLLLKLALMTKNRRLQMGCQDFFPFFVFFPSELGEYCKEMQTVNVQGILIETVIKNRLNENVGKSQY